MKKQELHQSITVSNCNKSINAMDSKTLQALNISLTNFLTKKFGAIGKNVVNCEWI